MIYIPPCDQETYENSSNFFIGFRSYPKVLPGSLIFVPEKSAEKDKTSVGEIVGYTTSLVSIIALINSL